LGEDPLELKDRAAEPEFEDLVARLRESARQWAESELN
jgi:hypothetical protein